MHWDNNISTQIQELLLYFIRVFFYVIYVIYIMYLKLKKLGILNKRRSGSVGKYVAFDSVSCWASRVRVPSWPHTFFLELYQSALLSCLLDINTVPYSMKTIKIE